MAKAPANLYVVIIAGGVGTRLWPKSRKALPKQFFHLDGDLSLSQLTYQRLKGFIPDDHIYVVAPAHYRSQIQKNLPQIPKQNRLLEPVKQGTTAANLLSASVIYHRDPNAIVHLLVADDYLQDTPRFHRMSSLAAQQAADDSVIVFGVKPRSPHTGFGYIKTGKKLSTHGDIQVFKALKFVEKPDERRARRYVSSSNYYWHGSGFAAPVQLILDTLSANPQINSIVTKINQHVASGKSLNRPAFLKLYKQITKDPIETTFLEKVKSTKMITLEDTWNDVGSWAQVYEIFPKDAQRNVILGNPKNVVTRNSFHNLIFASDRLIAITDMEGMVIVDTGDALLACPMVNAQNVKALVEILKSLKLDKLI